MRLFGLAVFGIAELDTDEADRLNLLPEGNIREGCSLLLDANHQQVYIILISYHNIKVLSSELKWIFIR